MILSGFTFNPFAMPARPPCLRVAALLSFLTPVATSALPAPAIPRSSPIVQVADTTTVRSFAIGAQPLLDAIRELERLTSLRIEMDSLVAAGRRSPGIVGVMSASEALRGLLAGSGVTARFVDARSAVLHRESPPGVGDQGRQALAPVRVTARATAASTYTAPLIISATRTPTLLRDVPQSVTVVTRKLIEDQAMRGMADVVRYMPGITMGQGEGNRDQPTIRGNGSTADFFVDGIRDDVQYFRDLYNVERVEALRGSNAMAFGRGGGGGVLNRVTKEAGWEARREVSVLTGTEDDRRASVDLGRGLTNAMAGRVNAMYENSGMFRDGVTIERSGINPTITIAPFDQNTRLMVAVERFDDRRTADRGIPSFNGRPVETDRSTFFGDAERSFADIGVGSATATIVHDARGRWSLRNRTSFTAYDKVYQNVFPGAVTSSGDSVSIAAYNNATDRRNLFNQTDVTTTVNLGGMRHLLLVGAELGQQTTGSHRETGYFDDVTTSARVTIDAPRVERPITFRQSATDADNDTRTRTASLYVQDQASLGAHLQLIAGLRYEHFGIRYHDNRADVSLDRTDGMLSPRLGMIVKPTELLSFYGSYSMSFLPSSGDQFSSLTNVTRGLEPERFTNYEIGAKWDAFDRLAVTAAAYRLDRTNTRAPHPTDPAITLQTGSQRTRGFELGVSGNLTGAWEVAGAFTHQKAFITSTPSSAADGALVPLVPRTAMSLWNRYQLLRPVGVGLGIIRQGAMFAAIDNTVSLPAFTRLDAGAYFTLTSAVRAQVNVENVLDEAYYPTAHSNNNISPGAPRIARASFTIAF